jgi:D-citramalate synthase
MADSTPSSTRSERCSPPGFEFPELLDYELQIPKGGRTSALTEVFITWGDGARTVRTRGVSPHQVLAGVRATLRMLNMKLHQAADPSEP